MRRFHVASYVEGAGDAGQAEPDGPWADGGYVSPTEDEAGDEVIPRDSSLCTRDLRDMKFLARVLPQEQVRPGGVAREKEGSRPGWHLVCLLVFWLVVCARPFQFNVAMRCPPDPPTPFFLATGRTIGGVR